MAKYKRITTEEPQGIVQHVHNFVLVKDGEIFLRIGDNEISLIEYIRKMDKELYNIEYDDSHCNAEDFGEHMMDDDRFTNDMYFALIGFAEVRKRLKKYEDSGLSSKEVEKLKVEAELKDQALRMIIDLWDSGTSAAYVDEFIEEYNEKCDFEEMEITEDTDKAFIARQIAENAINMFGQEGK